MGRDANEHVYENNMLHIGFQDSISADLMEGSEQGGEEEWQDCISFNQGLIDSIVDILLNHSLGQQDYFVLLSGVGQSTTLHIQHHSCSWDFGTQHISPQQAFKTLQFLQPMSFETHKN